MGGSWVTNIEIRQLIALAREAVDGFASLVALAQTKEEAGRVSDFDVVQAQVSEMTAEQAAATAQYGQTVLEAFGEVESPLASERLLREGVASWRRKARKRSRFTHLHIRRSGRSKMCKCINLALLLQSFHE